MLSVNANFRIFFHYWTGQSSSLGGIWRCEAQVACCRHKTFDYRHLFQLTSLSFKLLTPGECLTLWVYLYYNFPRWLTDIWMGVWNHSLLLMVINDARRGDGDGDLLQRSSRLHLKSCRYRIISLSSSNYSERSRSHRQNGRELCES